MATIDSILIDQIGEELANAAIALKLEAQPIRSHIYRFSKSKWEVELRQGRNYAVARTSSNLDRAAVLDQGIDAVHQALDLVSVESGEHLATSKPADDHVGFVIEKGKTIIWCSGVADLAAEITLNAVVRRADGTIEQPPPPVPPDWTPAFRFHRLSQSSNDLFEAFRNMFLGLEAVFDLLFPKQPKEGEKEWVLRAMREVGSKVDLQIFAPNSSDTAAELTDMLYGIRVRVFHAKQRKSFVPQERSSYMAVAKAYPILVSLWTEIAAKWLGIRRGGGVLTFHGLMLGLESFASFKFAVSNDMSPLAEAENRFSSPSSPAIEFLNNLELIKQPPTRGVLRASVEAKQINTGMRIGRLGVLRSDGQPLLVTTLDGGLTLDRIDVLESSFAIRLMNRGVPKTEFS